MSNKKISQPITNDNGVAKAVTREALLNSITCPTEAV